LSGLLQNDDLNALERFKIDLQWFEKNYRELKDKCDKQFVAILHENVVKSSRDSLELKRQLKEEYGNLNQFLIRYVGDIKMTYS
jgi:hypothetical protein